VTDRTGIITSDRSRFAVELETVCTSKAWQQYVLEHGPYLNAEAVAAASDEAVAVLDPADLLEALAGHPRIGERAEPGHSELSASEQRGMTSATEEQSRLMRAGNAAYEQKFDRVYLVCATGLSADELYARLLTRLGNDEETEEQVTRAELGKINRLRLRNLLEL
jgi:2-oxo-4-hydroxy-4-carboxy-5-ureidoimidazoline decarboxylase